jgi:BA14K-like protein
MANLAKWKSVPLGVAVAVAVCGSAIANKNSDQIRSNAIEAAQLQSLVQMAEVRVEINRPRGLRDRRRDREDRSDRRWRCSYRDPYCRDYMGGRFYDDRRRWNRGPGITFRFNGPSLSIRHVDWCRDRYRSYNPRTNTWLSYSGQYRQCVSPY